MGSADEFVDQIDQATGMVAEQADSTMDEALVLLALRAESLGQGMHETAVQVLDRQLSFDHSSLLERRSGNV